MGRGHLRSTDRPQPALGEAPLRLSRGLILVALLALLAAGLWGRGPSPLEAQGLQEDQRAKGQGPAPGQPTLEARLGRLKAELEGELAGVKEQQMVTALALKYASQAWALAAEAQALENSPWSAAERIEWLSQAWRDKAAPRSSRETAALKLYFESLVS
ncbi:MAG: hypothetical protein LBE01_06095, partial [Deltaproteobacteria bacterium]|nr:hypothetical protein [Deltaproteobacteria bacterium]